MVKPLKRLAAAAVLAGSLLIATPAFASQNFGVLNNNAQDGMLMSLSQNKGIVEPASDENASALVGVIGPSTDAINTPLSQGQVYVRTDGEVDTLVSTLNGNVSVGDRIAPSSLEGIGVKSTGSGWIAGVAQGSLDSKTQGAVASQITDTHGKKRQVYVARIPVLIKVTYYTVPASGTGNQSSFIPASIQTVADKIADRHVSSTAIVLSFILLLAGVILASQLINAAIRGGFDAIARQPLTKTIILRKIVQTFAVAAGIVLVVFAGTFLLIRYL